MGILRKIEEQHISEILEFCKITLPEEGFTDPNVFLSWYPDRVIGLYIRSRKTKKMKAFLFGVSLEKAYYIMCIGVHPKYSRKGFGKMLLHSFLLNVPDPSLPVWCKIFKNNKTSIQFFKKNGFKEEPKKNIPKGLKKSFGLPYYPYKWKRKNIYVDIPFFDFLYESQKLADKIRKINS